MKETKISIDNLIIFSIFLINEKKESCSFERITKECFDFFPKVFSLENYSWPDTRKLDRPLRFLKKSGIIKENHDKNFTLTPKGLKTAKEIKDLLRQEKLKI